MMLRQTKIHWHQFKPLNIQLVVKADPEQVVTTGGIILTDTKPMAASLGYFTGVVLRIGDDVEETLGLNPLGKRIVYRQYVSEVMIFSERHEDGSRVFLLKAPDVEAIVDDGVKVDTI